MKTLIKLFEHLQWANQRILEILAKKGEETNEGKRLFSHILLCEQLWLQRIKGLDSNPKEIWNELCLEDCSILMALNSQQYSEILTTLSNNSGEDIVHYQNSSGTTFSTSILDILTHVALHGQYHRGQINRMLREDGGDPTNVDFITFVR